MKLANNYHSDKQQNMVIWSHLVIADGNTREGNFALHNRTS